MLFYENIITDMCNILQVIQKLGVTVDCIVVSTQISNINVQFSSLYESINKVKKTLLIVEQKYDTLNYDVEIVNLEIQYIKDKINVIEDQLDEIYIFLKKQLKKINKRITIPLQKLKNIFFVTNNLDKKIVIQQVTLKSALENLKIVSRKMKHVSDVVQKLIQNSDQCFETSSSEKILTKIRGKVVVTCKLD